MKYNIPERVLKDIILYSRKYDIEKVILFGSRARGTNTQRSDIDIAVEGSNFDGFYWELKENSHTLLLFDIVKYDDNISLDLKNEIERDGVVIYEKV